MKVSTLAICIILASSVLGDPTSCVGLANAPNFVHSPTSNWEKHRNNMKTAITHFTLAYAAALNGIGAKLYGEALNPVNLNAYLIKENAYDSFGEPKLANLRELGLDYYNQYVDVKYAASSMCQGYVAIVKAQPVGGQVVIAPVVSWNNGIYTLPGKVTVAQADLKQVWLFSRTQV